MHASRVWIVQTELYLQYQVMLTKKIWGRQSETSGAGT